MLDFDFYRYFWFIQILITNIIILPLFILVNFYRILIAFRPNRGLQRCGSVASFN